MRGHKCSYRVKLTMRLGYVNHWFVEVLGDHDQFGSLNDSVPTPSLSPSTKKGEDADISPSNDLNKMHMKTSSPNTPHHRNSPETFVTMVPQVTIAMPNSLPNSFHGVLPNTIYTTPSMNLPVNLPVLTQPTIIPSQNLPLFMTAGTNLQRDSAYMGMVMSEFTQQDVPLPLVKMKREPIDNGYHDKPSPTDSSESNSMDSFHSNTPKMSSQSRAQARKKFTPYQVINASHKENQTKQDLADSTTLCNSEHTSAHRNGNQRGTQEPSVRRELRDFVAKRELDRCLGVQTNPKDEEMSDSLRQLMSEGEMENGYTYIWDEDLALENGKGDKVEGSTEAQVQDKPCIACLRILSCSCASIFYPLGSRYFLIIICWRCNTLHEWEMHSWCRSREKGNAGGGLEKKSNKSCLVLCLIEMLPFVRICVIVNMYKKTSICTLHFTCSYILLKQPINYFLLNMYKKSKLKK